MRKIKRSNIKFVGFNQNSSINDKSRDTTFIHAPVNFLNNFYTKMWYLRVMGLRHSPKKNVFMQFTDNVSSKIFLNKNYNSFDKIDDNSSQPTAISFSVNNYNACIKYVYNE